MSAHEDQVTLNPPGKLKSEDAEAFLAMCVEKRGRPVSLDFGNVSQIGSQCLQILLSAKAAWQSDNLPFEIINMSSDVRDWVHACGLSPAQLGTKEAQNDG